MTEECRKQQAKPRGLCGAGTHWEHMPVPIREAKPQAQAERWQARPKKGRACHGTRGNDLGLLLPI